MIDHRVGIQQYNRNIIIYVINIFMVKRRKIPKSEKFTQRGIKWFWACKNFTIYTRATKFLHHDTFEVSVIMDSHKKLKRDGIIVKEGVCQLTPGANWPRSPLQKLS